MKNSIDALPYWFGANSKSSLLKLLMLLKQFAGTFCSNVNSDAGQLSKIVILVNNGSRLKNNQYPPTSHTMLCNIGINFNDLNFCFGNTIRSSLLSISIDVSVVSWHLVCANSFLCSLLQVLKYNKYINSYLS